MAAQIWWREFTRAEGPDESKVADADFLKKNLNDDFFGRWLQQGDNSSVKTHDELLQRVYANPQQQLQIFPVADGSVLTTQPTDSWYQPHLRLISLVTLPTKAAFSTDPNEYTILIAGSNALHDPHGFLDVASWNGKTTRYYRRDVISEAPDGLIGWIYFGKSEDAFDDSTAYLGAFNGHVNGTCMMKEIHQPWLHWKSTLMSNFDNCLSDYDKNAFLAAPYLSQGKQPLGGKLIKHPSELESAVQQGVNVYFDKRLSDDFLTTNGKLKATNIPVRRWMAHLLWTTTVNLGCTATSDAVSMPSSVVFNDELSNCFPDLLPSIDSFDFNSDHYKAAVEDLDLVIMQEVPAGTPSSEVLPQYTIGGHHDKGDRGTGYQSANFVVTQHGEGTFKFITLQASIEDTIGLNRILNIPTDTGKVSLLTEEAWRALLLVDFWNPIYSWRRGVLMAYVPKTTATTKESEGPVFDLEAKFKAAVQESSYASTEGNPERTFLELYAQFQSAGDHGKSIFDNSVTKYCEAVRKRIAQKDGMLDYMKLAESRRRTFRPLPLDEFGYTLPFARKESALTAFVEMQPDGSIAEVPERGRDFLREYIGRLSNYSPVFPPGLPDAAPLRPPTQGGPVALGIGEDGVVEVDSPLKLLGRSKEAHKDKFPRDDILPANMALPCNYSRNFIQKARKSRGCPFAGRSVYQVTPPARVAT